MPRRKLPDNVKELRGTNQPCRAGGAWIDDLDPVDEMPEAPRYLSIEAKEYWGRVTVALQERGILSELDLEALEVLCVLYGRMRAMATAGVDVNCALVTQLRLYQTEFGLTPYARSKPGLQVSKPTGSKFDRNGLRGHTRSTK